MLLRPSPTIGQGEALQATELERSAGRPAPGSGATVGEPVPHRHAGILGQGLDRAVRSRGTRCRRTYGPAPGAGVGHGLLAELDVALAEVLGVGALVDAGRVKAHRVRVEGFSKIRAMFRPSRARRTPARLFILTVADRSSRSPISGAKVEELEEVTSTKVAGHDRLQLENRRAERRSNAVAHGTRPYALADPNRAVPRRNAKNSSTPP